MSALRKLIFYRNCCFIKPLLMLYKSVIAKAQFDFKFDFEFLKKKPRDVGINVKFYFNIFYSIRQRNAQWCKSIFLKCLERKD